MINQCRYCNAIFRSVIKRTVCDSCQKIDDERFEAIRAYLDQYPNSNAMQVADGLEIDTSEVIRYIDEGRLRMVSGTFERLEDGE